MANRLKVLAELRPAMEGFAGIPQEARLLFSTICDLETIEATGLINHGGTKLMPALKKGRNYPPLAQHKRINVLSRHVASHSAPEIRNRLRWALWMMRRSSQIGHQTLKGTFGLAEELSDFPTAEFADFVWEMLFSKTLQASEFDKVTSANYAVLRAPWADLHRIGLWKLPFARHLRVNTRGYDVFIAQTPFPARISPNTQLVVRYHDAVPIFLPHTISNTAFHRNSHYSALLSNSKTGVFACGSEAVRQDLLKIFPQLERRAEVIHHMVSPNYFVERATRERLMSVVRNRADSQSRSAPSTKPIAFDAKAFRYILMVATIEPRKNHMKLIEAWERARAAFDLDLKLVLVGEHGWRAEPILEAINLRQETGQLFKLSNVPAAELRLLYNGAEVVVCPSISEGFDLTGVEAMLCGGPVVASDIPVHREIYGNACEYFNPYSVDAAANALLRVCHPDRGEYRKELIARGLKRGAKYEQANMAPRWEALLNKIRSGAFKEPTPSAIFSQAHGLKEIECPRAVGEARGKDAIAVEKVGTRSRRLGRDDKESSGAPILIFIHVPKTAGTSFRIWLDEFFGEAIYWHNLNGVGDRQGDVNQLFEATGPSGLEKYPAIGGHFTYDAKFIRAIRRRRLICSIVRDPIDRIISYYEFVRKRQDHQLYIETNGHTLFESLSKKGKFFKNSSNFHTRAIFGRKNTNSDCIIFGKMESITILASRLEKIYGCKGPLIRNANVGEHSYKDEIVKQNDFGKAVDLITKINDKDIELYNSFDSIKEVNSEST